MIIRAYELKPGDIFRKQGTLYLVVKRADTVFVYSAWCESSETNSGTYNSIGLMSQERVEYIGVKPKKKTTKPISGGKGYDPTIRARGRKVVTTSNF